MMRTKLVVLALLLVAGCTAQAAPAPATPADKIAAGDFAGPVDIGGGREIYLECRGTGSPTVVLVSGYHDSADLWTLSEVKPPVAGEAVLPGIARQQRVCAFDRPGTLRYSQDQGTITKRTTPVPMPRTAADVVADLKALLATARVPGPYVITAHSLGGLFARLYAQTHPGDVRGLVLVDTFSPEVPAIFGPLWPAYRELLTSTGTQADPNAERIDIDASIAQIQQAPELPDVPIAVLSKTLPFGGLPPTLPGGLTGADIERLWPQVQAGVAAIRPQIPQTLVNDSDHYIQVAQPDVIISATELVIGRQRAR
jgi:pimeloyl-ACP methyl ester carboxylesterase